MILETLGERPVAFNPLLARISGGVATGLFMCQLLYWWKKGCKNGWIFKTIKEIREETYLSRSEQDRAIKKWRDLGVIEVKREGIPPKRHFKICMESLFTLLEKETGNPDLRSKAVLVKRFAYSNKTYCR